MLTAAASASASALASRHAPRLSRRLATAAAAAATTVATTSAASTTSGAVNPPDSRPARPPQYKGRLPDIRTGVIINRSPLLTRDRTSFERAFFDYQERIRRTFHNPFPYDFYFKPGSIVESKFTIEERDREREIFYAGFGADSKFAPQPKLSLDDLRKIAREDDAVASREHESDRTGDIKSLDRKGQRNLYLVLKQTVDSRETWRFPEGAREEGEPLYNVRLSLLPSVSPHHADGPRAGRGAPYVCTMWQKYGHLDSEPTTYWPLRHGSLPDCYSPRTFPHTLSLYASRTHASHRLPYSSTRRTLWPVRSTRRRRATSRG
jgi:hypothetical protein